MKHNRAGHEYTYMLYTVIIYFGSSKVVVYHKKMTVILVISMDQIKHTDKLSSISAA